MAGHSVRSQGVTSVLKTARCDAQMGCARNSATVIQSDGEVGRTPDTHWSDKMSISAVSRADITDATLVPGAKPTGSHGVRDKRRTALRDRYGRRHGHPNPYQAGKSTTGAAPDMVEDRSTIGYGS